VNREPFMSMPPGTGSPVFLRHNGAHGGRTPGDVSSRAPSHAMENPCQGSPSCEENFFPSALRTSSPPRLVENFVGLNVSALVPSLRMYCFTGNCCPQGTTPPTPKPPRPSRESYIVARPTTIFSAAASSAGRLIFARGTTIRLHLPDAWVSTRHAMRSRPLRLE